MQKTNMNLAEIYSSHFDLKIDKPFIFEKFYPLQEVDYITLHVGNEEGDPNYLYWQEVINLILPSLIKKYNNLSLIATNSKSKIRYNNCNQLNGSLSPNELAYIIKNSKMHISEGGIDLDFASYYNKKTAYINSNDKFNPFWNSSHIKLNEGKDNTNDLKPEKIANKILNFIGASPEPLKYETIFIGDNYINKSMQFIPEDICQFENPFSSPLVVRMDKFFNEQSLASCLSRKPCVIITNKKINNQLLLNFKKNIALIVYIIETDDDPSFIKEARKANISANLISYLDEKTIKEKKINYMEYGTISKVAIPQKEDVEILKNEEIGSLYYVSNGPVIHNQKTYKSVFDWENGIQSDENGGPTKIMENEEFWKEINNLYLFKKVD